jgi:hypothetical protein
MRSVSGPARLALWQGATYALSLMLLAATLLTWSLAGYLYKEQLELVAATWLFTAAAAYVPMRAALVGYAVLCDRAPKVESRRWLRDAFDTLVAVPLALLPAWLLRDMEVVPVSAWVTLIVSLIIAGLSVSLPHQLWLRRARSSDRAIPRRHARAVLAILALYFLAWLATALFGLPAIRQVQFSHIATFQEAFTHQPLKSEQHNVVHEGYLGWGSERPPWPFASVSRGLIAVPFIVISDWEVNDRNSGGAGRTIWLWTFGRPRSLITLWFWAVD